ncbi:Crp/Fnr family transcriptional regulator [Mucilaginibacter sp. HC2]|uniref:Crp/Fnr family transcriptional regulator n=1 Tax=Mucilaginibacter inviolabilis TaxID=2714892 RepID=UPI00140DDA0A|nr:Crp/Fnr family transcriptional regulator [Mucilaginibacter inviolabilis]NHA06952.1 Crp/Fnr family transcriptional regulator [Mucilaginibacter inviolabilis]
MHPLIQHIQKITSDSGVDGDAILPFFETKIFKKKDILQEEDKRCLWYFFVIKGCLRLYFTDYNGVEQTMQFALENWWMTDLNAFRSGQRSGYTIQALEATEVLAITAANYELLMAKFPITESYFRLIYERAYAASLLRIRMISRMPKDEFYELFQSRYPEFIQRIPQKVLASFLGFTPEYLSELRKHKVKGKNNS